MKALILNFSTALQHSRGRGRLSMYKFQQQQAKGLVPSGLQYILCGWPSLHEPNPNPLLWEAEED